jgi:NitT/TauT family transport system permease protein
MMRIGFLVLILVSWQLYSTTVSRALLAGPVEIAGAFWELYVTHPAMYEALGTTFLALILGLVLAIVIGVAVGIGVGVSKRFEWIVGPYITFLFAIPSIALIPLLIIWLGIDFPLRVFLVVISAVFPVIINTAAGVRGADRELVEAAHSFVATPRQTLLTVRLPAALPFVFAGVNQALSLALAGVIVAEMTATVTGLGGLIITYANFFQTAKLFVPIITLMAASVLLNYGLAAIEKRAMPWHAAGGGH